MLIVVRRGNARSACSLGLKPILSRRADCRSPAHGGVHIGRGVAVEKDELRQRGRPGVRLLHPRQAGVSADRFPPGRTLPSERTRSSRDALSVVPRPRQSGCVAPRGSRPASRQTRASVLARLRLTVPSMRKSHPIRPHCRIHEDSALSPPGLAPFEVPASEPKRQCGSAARSRLRIAHFDCRLTIAFSTRSPRSE